MRPRAQKWTLGTICTVLGLAGGAVGATVRVGIGARAMAREVITETAQQAVAPMRAELDGHLAQVARDRPQMLNHARKVERMLLALCQATPRAKCVEADE